ncbi:MAG: OmpH family outer membrane protein [Candidatus Sedimenticola sp. (ex Thyasira tokunagai)]
MWNKLILLVILGLFLGGCNQSPAVAVLDIGRLAEESGLKKITSDILTKTRDELQAQLLVQQEELKAQVEAQQAKLSDPPTQQEMQQLAQLSAVAGRQLQAAQQKANLTLHDLGQDLAQQFRTQVQPHARRVAVLRGMNVVLLDDRKTVLVALPEIDITDAVIAEISNVTIELKTADEGVAEVKETAPPDTK